jgi:parallel beta-helix repeat protein
MLVNRLLGMVPLELRLAIALSGLLVGLCFLGPAFTTAHAAGPRFVAPNGSDSGDCTNSAAPCATPQYTVDIAAPGDEIRLASGTYTGAQVRAGITQTVYLNKTVTIRGGYTATNWTTPDPVAHPTTLDAQRRGRVFYISGNISPTIEGLRLINGDATVFGKYYSSHTAGGSIFSITATTTLRDNWIMQSRAFGGGGVYILSGVAEMSGNTISGNSTGSGSFGGGVSLIASVAVLTSNRIISNTGAYTGFPVTSSGGGVYAGGSNVTFTNNIIAGNRAYFTGGGVDVEASTITMTGNLIANNRIDSNGGGLFLHLTQGTIISNTITGNTSFGSGGGVYIFSSPDTLLRRNVIADNQAASGGGVALNASDNVLDSNLISQNHAFHGGGLTLGNSSPIVTNTVIADNTADTGSGMYIINGALHFIHTTIARNTASGGNGGDGISLFAANGRTASLTLTNTILVGHAVGMSTTAETTATLNSVLWFGNRANTSGPGVFTIANAVDGNPAFAADGYHLTACSVARGRGVNAGVATDIDGDSRSSSAVDLGADQFALVGAMCHKLYLPFVSRQ